MRTRGYWLLAATAVIGIAAAASGWIRGHHAGTEAGGARAGDTAPDASSPSPSLSTVLTGAPVREALPLAGPAHSPLAPSPSDAVIRRQLESEIRGALEQIREGDAASWVRGIERIKMVALSARSADPDYLLALRDELLPILLPALADTRRPNPQRPESVRTAIVEALRTWDWDGTIVVPPLLAAWPGATPALQAGILDALRDVSPKSLPGRDVLRSLVSEATDPDLARAALRALERVPEGSDARDVDLAGRLLCSRSAETRMAALALLQTLPYPDARLTWSAQVEAAWDDPDRDVRSAAVGALAASDPARAEQLAVARLADADPARRGEAAWAIAGLTPHPESVDALLNALSDPDAEVRATVANALVALPSVKERSIPALRAILIEGGRPARAALATLARLDWNTAAPDVEAALSSPEPYIRELSVALLQTNASASHLGSFVDAVGDVDEGVARAAGRALRETERVPVGVLIRALERARPAARRDVIQALSSQGSRALPAVPAIERLISDPECGAAAKSAIATIRSAAASER